MLYTATDHMEETIPQVETPTRQYTFDRRGGSSSKGKRAIFLLALLLIVGGLAFGASRFLGITSQETQQAEVTPTPSEFIFSTDIPEPTEEEGTTPTSEPTKTTSTPTAKPSVNPIDKATGLDRSTLSVEVQNGSGAAGVAGKAADFLRGLGYNVVKTANADNFEYQKVVIQIKNSKSAFLPLLKKDIEASYAIGNTSSDLSASVSADTLVIVGK